MSLHFHSLKVADIIRETQDTVSIAFEVPESLKQNFAYKSGQYLNLKFNINGKEARRSYSISSCPGKDEYITVTCKKVRDGLVSNYINDTLKKGDTVDVMDPAGHFFVETAEDNKLHYVLIGAGSGITPLVSILQTVLIKEKGSKVTLLYGNRNEENIIFKDKLIKLENEFSERLNIVYSISQPGSSWQGAKGRLAGDYLNKLLKSSVTTDVRNALFFLCGPGEMIEGAESALISMGVFPGNIHREYFTTPVTTSKEQTMVDVEENKVEEKVIEASSDIESVTVILDDEEHIVPLALGQNILDAAMEIDLDPPYSCQSGICSTCRAKLISGKVRMDEREGLTEEEIKEGYILTCQSHPLTNDVKVVYD